MNISNVNIETVTGPIGVFCSGGADSTILLYSLLKNTDCEIYVFTLGNSYKNHINIEIAKRVIDKCQELTGKTISQHIIRKASIQTREEIFSTEFLDYVDNGTVEIMYTGFTSNPPHEVTSTFQEETDLTIRSPDYQRPYWYRNNTIHTPFSNIDKSTIARMYEDLEIIDTLFPVTRSCEWHIDMGGDDPGYGHCGRCWWCEERLWAFKKLQ